MTNLLLRSGACTLLAMGAVAASAQQAPVLAIGAHYSYVHSNVLPGCDCFSLNGGGLDVQVGLTKHIAAIGDATVVHKGGITPDGYNLTQFTYLVGGRYWPTPPHARLRPFGEVKLGGASAFGTLSPSSTGLGKNTTFAFELGGGLDIRLRSKITLVPVQVNYLLTDFSNAVGNHQNDLRVSAGLKFFLRR